MELKEILDTALDDERRARATYLAVIDAFGEVRPVVNIVDSEERHIDALLRLYERYGVEVPSDAWAGRIQAPESLAAACEAGVRGEIENAALYEPMIESEMRAGRLDVADTLRNLMLASQENHLPAFERALARERDGRPGRGAGGPGAGRGPGRRRRHRGGRGPGGAADA